jgi:hypothetical protein
MSRWTKTCGVLALVLLGCTGSDICTSHKVPVLSPDGGAFRCVVSEDCPRPSNVSVCLTNNTPEKPCVTCADTASTTDGGTCQNCCIETIPDACD